MLPRTGAQGWVQFSCQPLLLRSRVFRPQNWSRPGHPSASRLPKSPFYSSVRPHMRAMSTSKLPFSNLQPEAELAVHAVRSACRLTKAVQQTLGEKDTLIKSDDSPVTVADLSAQALISLRILSKFPHDPIIGEEDTTELRKNAPLRQRVIDLVLEYSDPGEAYEEDQILDAIDKGNAPGGSKGRFWTIDPVDGTSGFVRKQQYAVCLSLIIDGQVELGVIGCPNLGSEPAALGHEVMPNGDGVLMVAVRDEGSYSTPLASLSFRQIHLPASPPASQPLTFLESVEAGHSAHKIQARIGELLDITRPSLRMDSQAKYTCLARGEGGVYLRIPTKYVGGKEYQEKVWDHAPGSLLVTEAGGICTDMFGKPLDFSKGRTLSANEGIVAAGTDVHPKAVQAVTRALEEAKRVAV